MAAKQMILIPIYWGEWWVPARGNAYNWAEVNGLMGRVVGGRYMDGLNQYGVGRGAVTKTHVYQIDPPESGFSDFNMQWMFKTSIDAGYVPTPDDFDLATQQPFYALVVKPGIEHLRDATPDGTVKQWDRDPGTGAYHFDFTYAYGDGWGAWKGQACWIKGDSTALGTVQRWTHEMAEAYTAGQGEISDLCQGDPAVVVDGVLVPQYWSVADGGCQPTADPGVTVRRDDLVDAGRSVLRGAAPQGFDRVWDLTRLRQDPF